MAESEQHRVLIVEDDRAIASEVMEILDSLGHAYEHTETLVGALEHLDSKEFCVVLLDLQIKAKDKSIPNVASGQTCLVEIRKRNPGRKPGVDDAHYLQVLIMSSHARDHESVVWALQHRGDDFILKPFSDGDTSPQEKIRRALHRSERDNHVGCAEINRKARGLQTAVATAAAAPVAAATGAALSLGGRPMRKRTAVMLGGEQAPLSAPCFILALQLIAARLRGGALSPEALGTKTSPRKLLERLNAELVEHLPAGATFAVADEDDQLRLSPALTLGAVDCACIDKHENRKIRKLAAEIREAQRASGAAGATADHAVPSPLSRGRKAARAAQRRLVLSHRYRDRMCWIEIDGIEVKVSPKSLAILVRLALARRDGEGWADEVTIDPTATGLTKTMSRLYDYLRDAGIDPDDVIENNGKGKYRLAYTATEIELDLAKLADHASETVRNELRAIVPSQLKIP